MVAAAKGIELCALGYAVLLRGSQAALEFAERSQGRASKRDAERSPAGDVVAQPRRVAGQLPTCRLGRREPPLGQLDHVRLNSLDPAERFESIGHHSVLDVSPPSTNRQTPM